MLNEVKIFNVSWCISWIIAIKIRWCFKLMKTTYYRRSICRQNVKPSRYLLPINCNMKLHNTSLLKLVFQDCSILNYSLSQIYCWKVHTYCSEKWNFLIFESSINRYIIISFKLTTGIHLLLSQYIQDSQNTGTTPM